MRYPMRSICAVVLLLLAALMASGARGTWLAKVPATERNAVDPLAGDPNAAAAGSKLYARHCASCHGRNAEGIGRHPALKTARVGNATDGELQWLLRNGSLAEGMPAWSSLPEVQRWQLVRYLHAIAETSVGPNGARGTD